jgi:hypothetical protein
MQHSEQSAYKHGTYTPTLKYPTCNHCPNLLWLPLLLLLLLLLTLPAQPRRVAETAGWKVHKAQAVSYTVRKYCTASTSRHRLSPGPGWWTTLTW